MTTPVPQNEQTPSVSRLVVNAPVSATGPQRLNNDLLFLNSGIAHPIFNAGGLPSISSGSHKWYVAYTKSPGIKALKITIEANVAASGTRPAMTVTVTCSGTVSWIESSTSLVLNGASAGVTADTTVFSDSSQTTNHLDVSQLTNGSTYELMIDIADASGTAGISRGLYAINITEVPLSDTTPDTAPTTEMGASGGWLIATDRNRIVDGHETSQSIGYRRLIQQLLYARDQHYRQFQICRPEDTTNAWQTTATAATAWPFGYTANPTFELRGRALYGTSVAETFNLKVRYRTSTTQQVWIRVAVTPIGGATTNYDFKLANSSGAWTSTTVDSVGAALAVPIPCSSTSGGFNQHARVQLSLWNNSAGTVYVSQLHFRSA
jgi:hypothetical protein